MSKSIGRFLSFCLAACLSVPALGAQTSDHKASSSDKAAARSSKHTSNHTLSRSAAGAGNHSAAHVSTRHHKATGSSASGATQKSTGQHTADNNVVAKRRGRLRAYSHSILRAAGKPFRLLHVSHKPSHNQEEAKEEAKIPEPVAPNTQDASSLTHVYRLYDEGLNARLSGNYELATRKLLEASNSYVSTKSGLTLEAMIDFELGQAAEAGGNVSVAADAYTRCLRIKPNLIEASFHLSSMLMKAGELKAALGRARETVAANPADPAAHELLALVLDKSGLGEDAKLERNKAQVLLHSQPLPNPASAKHNQAPPIPAAEPAKPETGDSEVAPEEKETKPPPEQPVDSDVMKD
jgi:hypothetical protein